MKKNIAHIEKSSLKQKLPYFFIFIPIFLYIITASRTPGWVDATLIVHNVKNLTLGSWVNYHNLFHFISLLISLYNPLNLFLYSDSSSTMDIPLE